ncbi:MAG: prolipoprotein diacylglyceryl transferase [Clostridia bacterium]|nr:prolipoprotein diacylglyceryl transferase [Clostridia bacterium]
MLPYLHLGKTQIPMYGLCMAVAMLLAVGLSYIRTRRRGEDGDRLITIALFAVIFGILGSKILYFFVTYSWEEIVELVHSNGVKSLFEGGLVFYGGLIGGVIGAFIGAAVVKTRLSRYSDAVVPTLPLAHAIGRMGCFCSGCCYGRATDSWIGMCFPHSISGLAPDVAVIPTQLIESGANLLVFIFLLWFTRKRRRGFTALFVYMMLYGVIRFLIEFLRGDEIRGFFGALSTSQWISLALIATGAVGLVLTGAKKKTEA